MSASDDDEATREPTSAPAGENGKANAPAKVKLSSLRETATAKMAREYLDSPTMRLARGSAMTSLSEQVAALGAKQTELDRLSRGFMPDLKVLDLAKSFADMHERMSGVTTLSSLLGSHRNSVIADAMRIKAMIPRDLAGEYLNKINASSAWLNSPAAEAARIGQWADLLSRSRLPDIAKLYRPESFLGSKIGLLHQQALEAAQGSFGVAGSSASARSWSGTLEVTRLKMSVMAGVGDLFGASSLPTLDAYKGLLGDWHTRPDLPARFWREPTERRHFYEDADVDAGLVEATPSEAVEVMIASGLTAGVLSGQSSVATFAIGDLTVSIHAPETKAHAVRIIETFEEELRRFISAKMEPLFGPKWFSQRAPGELVKKAKAARTAALKAGEKDPRILAYIDLGDLASIIQRGDNWAEVFEDIFRNHASFSQTMASLIAWRRPAAHSRQVDAVMFVELALLVHRLVEQITDDGAWRLAAEAEV